MKHQPKSGSTKKQRTKPKNPTTRPLTKYELLDHAASLAEHGDFALLDTLVGPDSQISKQIKDLYEANKS